MSDLYSNGAHYDALLGSQTQDLNFYLKQASHAQGPILELACGTGRLTLPLAKAGFEITGLDLSPGMLAHGRHKAALENLKIEWVCADMRSFDLGRKFALILLPYNSMEHLHDTASLEAMLSSVRAHLAPEGRFVLDVHQPELTLLNRHPGEIYPVDDMPPAPDGSIVTGEEVRYDSALQIHHIRWIYSTPEGGEPRSDALALRMFFPQELDALLRHNGFEILNKFGNFEEIEFGEGDLKQVLIASLT